MFFFCLFLEQINNTDKEYNIYEINYNHIRFAKDNVIFRKKIDCF